LEGRKVQQEVADVANEFWSFRLQLKIHGEILRDVTF
jgi:hypothetical protein